MSIVEKILQEAARPTSKNPQIDKLLEVISQSHQIQINPFSGRELIVDELGMFEMSWFNNRFHLGSIDSFNKGTGSGSKLLRIITDAADAVGVEIELGAKPYGNAGLKKKDLIDFYLRHGFEIVPGQYGIKSVPGILKYVLSKNGADEDVEMVRTPK